jgi:hypothetical protein
MAGTVFFIFGNLEYYKARTSVNVEGNPMARGRRRKGSKAGMKKVKGYASMADEMEGNPFPRKRTNRQSTGDGPDRLWDCREGLEAGVTRFGRAAAETQRRDNRWNRKRNCTTK